MARGVGISAQAGKDVDQIQFHDRGSEQSADRLTVRHPFRESFSQAELLR